MTWCDESSEEVWPTFWRKVVWERAAWRGAVKKTTEKFNDHLETSEKERKDGWKMRRKEGIQQASIELRYEE